MGSRKYIKKSKTLSKVNDLMTGKRKSLTRELEKSRTCLRNSLALSKVDDLRSGKRKSLTKELEESRKCIRMLLNDTSHGSISNAHRYFFIGKRNSLTTELEKSRNRLKIIFPNEQVASLRPTTSSSATSQKHYSKHRNAFEV